MKTYAIGRCKVCGCIGAAAVRHDDVVWAEDIVEFVEAGYMVSRLRTDQRVAINGCHDWCSEKP